MAYLVDTDVMVDISRRNAHAANYVDSLQDAWIAIVTAQELIVGARDKRDVAGIDSLIASYPVVHINDRIGERAYELLTGCGKSKLAAWLLKHNHIELFYARPRSSAVGDVQLLVA